MDKGVGGQGGGENRIDLGLASQLDLDEAGGPLDPSERLLNAFAAILADGVAGMMGSPPIHGGGACRPSKDVGGRNILAAALIVRDAEASASRDYSIMTGAVNIYPTP